MKISLTRTSVIKFVKHLLDASNMANSNIVKVQSKHYFLKFTLKGKEKSNLKHNTEPMNMEYKNIKIQLIQLFMNIKLNFCLHFDSLKNWIDPKVLMIPPTDQMSDTSGNIVHATFFF